jgi:glucose-6-phosphate 1-dehydrogenase
VLIEFKAPPQRLFADSAPTNGRTNYLRFQLPPSSAIALAARIKRKGKEFIGDQRELFLLEEQPGDESPWAVVDPVLKTHHRVLPYKRGSWGPKEADALIASDGRWHNPKPNTTTG